MEAKENCGMRSITIFTANQIFECLIRESEMGGACGTYGEKRNLKERGYLKDLSVCGRIVLKCIHRFIASQVLTKSAQVYTKTLDDRFYNEVLLDALLHLFDSIEFQSTYNFLFFRFCQSI